MKKITKMISSLLMMACVIGIMQVDVFADTYEEEQIINNEVGLLQGGDILHFNGTPTATFYDRNGVLLDTQTASTVTVPEYALTSANFSGWGITSVSSNEEGITHISFRAGIRPFLHTATVNEGESVTFTVNVEDLPLPHNYEYEWVAGGIAGGWVLEDSINSNTYTVTPDSPYYQDGFVLACRIKNIDNSGFFFTAEATVNIIEGEQTGGNNPIDVVDPIEPNIDTTNTINQKVVKTNDTLNYAPYMYLLLGSLVTLVIKKSIKE